MEKKEMKFYEAPEMEIMWMEAENQLLATSFETTPGEDEDDQW